MDHINILEMCGLKTFPSSSGGPPCDCTFGQHINVLQSESSGGHKVGELVVAHSQYPRLVTSTVNQTAGALSRNWIHPSKWRLHPDVVQDIWQEFGMAEVDLFASENTTLCPLWFAQMEESRPLRQDGLSHDWPDCLL